MLDSLAVNRALKTEDLIALSSLGTALWADPSQSRHVFMDTVAAMSLLDLPPDRLAERISRSLLERATLEGISASRERSHLPFFRLAPEERFILGALQLGKWTYDRIARVLGSNATRVAEIAWSSRLHLASSPSKTLYLPTGSSGSSCPEFHPAAPWTQRYLDQQVTSRERHFFEMHAKQCANCRSALNRSRAIHYSAAQSIPRPSDDELLRLMHFADQALSEVLRVKRPSERGVLESLRLFARHKDIRLLLLALALFMIWKLLLSSSA